MQNVTRETRSNGSHLSKWSISNFKSFITTTTTTTITALLFDAEKYFIFFVSFANVACACVCAYVYSLQPFNLSKKTMYCDLNNLQEENRRATEYFVDATTYSRFHINFRVACVYHSQVISVVFCFLYGFLCCFCCCLFLLGCDLISLFSWHRKSDDKKSKKKRVLYWKNTYMWLN